MRLLVRNAVVCCPDFDVPPMVQLTVDSEWIVEFAPLREMLLGLGGKFFQPVGGLVQAFPPILLRQISALGRSFPGSDPSSSRATKEYVKPTRTNSLNGPTFEVWTGFALGIDMWEPHSWLVRNGVILDVARRRTLRLA